MRGHNNKRLVLPGEPWNLALLTAREKKGTMKKLIYLADIF